MLHYETIEPHTLELLRKIQSLPELKDCRLVGGTSLALQIGHRKSVDLDFFGHLDCDAEDLKLVLSKVGQVIVLKQSANIHVFMIDDVKVDIVNYQYDWISPALVEDNLVLADKVDVAAMKINAIIGRGTKKDFIDIAFLLKEYSLSDLLRFFFKKYPDASIFLAAKSLAYYDDAEYEPMPHMFSEVTWEELKTFISKQYDDYEANY